ncbi:4a-hydroxytetrahydrobiopterin dehydratase [Paenibacillus thalictri]|uniref:4a-hydroxytetrahydrobiopterin dehydratase n=1 Tax=Paenibacillus thalictri TaxID=2527873 RepID=A0A4Q9DJP4_9BACL|nr:4a-hydroxytetrahydrobiopterin dehydratase [Paenibacillus thalictri]TBL72664.1 4a-hydroxytetrahydrobiopterin dehydratase [Paenibacillus thalictri]
MKLTEERIAERLERAAGWSREDGKWIVKKYRFPAFTGSVAFVNEVAQIAEELNHHPMIAIDYKLVTLRLTSWSAGGLTELDFTSAARYDAVYAQAIS